MSQNMWVHNSTNENIYCIAHKQLGWLIADVIVDVGLALVGVGALKSLVTAGRLPATIKTVSDLAKFTWIASQFLYGMGSVGLRSAGATQRSAQKWQDSSLIGQANQEEKAQLKKALDGIRRSLSVHGKIEPGKSRKIFSSWLDMIEFSYLIPELVQGIPTMDIFVLTESGASTSGPTRMDQSWVVDDQGLVEQAYGKPPHVKYEPDPYIYYWNGEKIFPKRDYLHGGPGGAMQKERRLADGWEKVRNSPKDRGRFP